MAFYFIRETTRICGVSYTFSILEFCQINVDKQRDIPCRVHSIHLFAIVSHVLQQSIKCDKKKISNTSRIRGKSYNASLSSEERSGFSDNDNSRRSYLALFQNKRRISYATVLQRPRLSFFCPDGQLLSGTTTMFLEPMIGMNVLDDASLSLASSLSSLTLSSLLVSACVSPNFDLSSRSLVVPPLVFGDRTAAHDEKPTTIEISSMQSTRSRAGCMAIDSSRNRVRYTSTSEESIVESELSRRVAACVSRRATITRLCGSFYV